MKLNNIKDITDFIFVGKEFEESGDAYWRDPHTHQPIIPI